VCPGTNPRKSENFRAVDGPVGRSRSGPAAFLALAAAAVLASCGGGPPGGGGFATCPAFSTLVSGRVVYEDKPYDTNGFLPHVDRPVRFASVQLRDADAPDTVLGTARTDAGGGFCVGVATQPLAGRAFVRVRADANVEGTRLYVVDYASDIYYVDGATVTVQAGTARSAPTLHVDEDTPWKAAPIGGSASFAGGAFNILDVASGGIQFVRDRWHRALPTLALVWQDRQTEGLGTFFIPGSNIIHIKGEVQEDSDEYDDDIILHEFGHFTMYNLGKDTSRGGVHYINGNTQDMRLAWSEGWANFFSTMVRDADPGRFSNRSGVRGILIDALFTEGAGRALRFAYEVATPEAFVPDPKTPDNQSTPVDRTLFKYRVVFGSSEVSVAAALWDIYAGLPGTPGIGRDGILAVVEEIAAEDPEETTFAAFWKALETAYPAAAADFLDLMIDDRLMSLTWDEKGADDTVAEVDGLTGAERDAHRFPGVFAGSFERFSNGHTLFPAGDVDRFRLEVESPATVRITTGNLNDGADTYLKILADDGTTVLAENDNYIPYQAVVTWGTDDGTVVGHFSTLTYPPDGNGLCGPYNVVSDDGTQDTTVSICPPNTANRSAGGNVALGDVQTIDYLASDVRVALGVGTYYVEVVRSPFAPPSSGPYGGYDLRVEGLPP